jgi:vacuolar-type H+-ATPase subunit C/Vma6
MRYYFLAAYLPELHRDDTKIRVSLGDLLEERLQIPEQDWKEIELVLLGRDIFTIERLLSRKPVDPVEHSLFSVEFWREQIRSPREGPDFLLEYLRSTDAQVFGPKEIDRLYGAYFDHVASETKSAFLRDYFGFQRDLRNATTALRARRKGIGPSEAVVGEGEFVDILGGSTAEDFGLSREHPWMEGLLKAETPDQLQELIEQLLWEYLDEHAGTDPFGFGVILAYLLKIEMLQKRLELSEEKGMERVRRVGGL